MVHPVHRLSLTARAPVCFLVTNVPPGWHLNELGVWVVSVSATTFNRPPPETPLTDAFVGTYRSKFLAARGSAFSSLPVHERPCMLPHHKCAPRVAP